MASRSAREVAYETIRSRIITMDLKPGDELNDRELAQELGISRTPMREALIMLNIAHMVVIKPQSGTHVAPIDLKLMEMEQFARFTLEKEILNRIRGRLTAEQEAAYRLNLESYRQLERDPDAENRETRMLDLDNAFHRRAFQLCGMEEHFDHMLSTFQHIERLRKFSLQTEENKSVCAAHTRILEAVLRGSEEDLSRALSDHLNRYKLSVEQARQRHPRVFHGGDGPPGGSPHLNPAQHKNAAQLLAARRFVMRYGSEAQTFSMVMLQSAVMASSGSSTSCLPSSLTLLAQPFHGSMHTKLSASCCHSTAWSKLSSASTVTLWPLPLSVRVMGNCTPVSRRTLLSAPSLRVRVIFSGAAGCSPLALSEQVAHLISKSTFSSLEALK